VNPDWKQKLRDAIQRSRSAAFVGIGHELRGDDAAGLLVVRRLQEAGIPAAKSGAQRKAPFFLEAGPLPETVSGPLRRYQPDLVLFIDAADMDCAPGVVDWIDPQKAVGFSAGTHAFPLCDFSQYLAREIGCEVFFLGIQPKNLEFDSPVSTEVQQAIEELAGEIRQLLDPMR
jgi:hydrogenase 3 maturation protease